MEKTYSILINTDIDHAFSAVDDEEKIQRWMGGSIKTQYLNHKDQETPLGTKFKQELVGLTVIEGEVIAYKKPILLGVGGNNPFFKSTLFYHFKPLPDKTTSLVCVMDIPTGNPVRKKMVEMLLPLIDSLVLKQMRSIKQLAEEHLHTK